MIDYSSRKTKEAIKVTWSVSLAVIRMLPVFLVLTGRKIRADEKLFMGWFGPRGLASIVFAMEEVVVKGERRWNQILIPK
jgi:NhaP-type Na+/H+ or K+/H+ antiporter